MRARVREALASAGRIALALGVSELVLEVVDPDWVFEPLEPGDLHPNASATRTMAAAVVKALGR
jgi:hypothetical protein